MGAKTHIPEGETLIFEGPQRSGKTMGMVAWAAMQYAAGRPLFSNIPLALPYRPVKVRTLELEPGAKSPFWGGNIALDELNFYFDCRNSGSRENRQFSRFLLQQKKQGCHLTGTTHALGSLDLRIRRAYDWLIQCECYPHHPATPVVLVMKIHPGPNQRGPGRPTKPRTVTLPTAPLMDLYDTTHIMDPYED